MKDDIVSLVQLADDDDPLRALQAVTQLGQEVARREAVQVRRARVAGYSWAEIAAVLGVSKQAVHKKYGGRRILRSEP